MLYLGERNIKLFSRNEGKIKSYDSCSDVRAWSHDIRTRGCYLRDWIKCDSPISVIPVCTVTNFLNIMTRKCKGKVTPRCHPECKSKVILDTICTSCHAIKDCLKDENEFGKYFEEEEFETSHWPCERCLEALKSIKLFWKVMTEKIFNVSVSVSDSLNSSYSSRPESSQNIAKSWQDEIVHQAIFIKKLTPLLRRHFLLQNTKGINCVTIQYDGDKANFGNNFDTLECVGDHYKMTAKFSEASSINSSEGQIKTEKSKIPLRAKTVDFGCNTIYNDNDELNKCKNELECLQQKFNLQSEEFGHLKRENMTLKLKLQTCSKNSLASYTVKNIMPDTDESSLEPFESYWDAESESAKKIKSNTIITLKTCKNKNFKHVAMLRVLHKTNENIFNETRDGTPLNEEENDPIEILSRVQTTFGKIVKREIDKVVEGKYNVANTDINASVTKADILGTVTSSNMTTTTSSACSSKFGSTYLNRKEKYSNLFPHPHRGIKPLVSKTKTV